jgi:hypothetical protein
MVVLGYRCHKCEAFVYSRHEEDHRKCDCGHVTVSGGPTSPIAEFKGDQPFSESLVVDATEKQLKKDYLSGKDKYGITRPYGDDDSEEENEEDE